VSVTAHVDTLRRQFDVQTFGKVLRTWSCAMSQLPSIFRKPVVDRTQKPVLVPFFNVPLSRLRLGASATSLPTVIVSSRIASTNSSIRR
jgi:hypothetical protein